MKSLEPIIYLITDGTSDADNFIEKKNAILNLVKTAVETKISLIQIREKNLPARFVYELASEAAKITRQSETKLLVNDRADIAVAAGADGVHLTAASLSVETTRRAFASKNFIVGASAHTTEEAETAKQGGADFIAFSPIFASPDKGKPQGVGQLREICERLKSFPVLALGGVDATNYRTILENGASGFAAIRFLSDEKNLRKLAADLRR